MNMVLNYLQYLGYILIFPGFLFCFVAGLLLCGIDRKLVARMQKRVGPPVLQPFYDFFKLCGKETIIPTAASKTTFLAAPIVGFAALVVIQLFIPIRGFTPFAVLGDIADVIVILYLLLIPAIATIMGGAASGSPYAGVGLSRLGSYVKLQAALGFDADHVWSEEERRSFSAAYYSFRTALEKCEGSRFPETIGDALLIFLQVFSFGELKAMTQTELERSITGIWPEVEVQARPAPITVNTESSVEVKGVLTKLMDSIRLPSHLNVAFVNELPPEKSAWIMSHDRGREYLERHMPDKVTTRVYNIDAEHDADALIDAAAADGAQVIFATTPRLISACRKAAVKHPNIKILNCSVSMPFPGVRTYYSRVYEGKFISGAVAGAMTKTGRIGYIASSPIYGVPAGINAFALGALLTNPDIKICLRWSSVSEDPISELKALGVDMISNRDVPSPEQPQDAWGLCRVDGSGAFFQILLCFRTLCDVIQEVLSLVLRHGFQFRHNAFHEAAKQENTVIALPAFFGGQLAVEHLVSVFVLL